ncbi:hypothetical protein [Nonomuraea sp. CA-141351]|uniref:hypothetical protein n=1 Tax=Nonomuraea sp. CA-141351 TaxID=3239996 RepID=UPI003D8EBE00
MNTVSRKVIGITAAALLAAAALPATAHAATRRSQTNQATAAPQSWGPFYSPSARRARAAGMVTATGEDHEVIPSAARLTVSGTVADLTRSLSTCGWAVFGIATVTPDGNNVTWQRHHVRTCTYRIPRRFSFSYHRVFKVEMKVCAEGPGPEPSIQCTAGNPAWTNIYVSPN